MAFRGGALNLRYLAAKFTVSAEAFALQMQNSATSSLTDALAKGLEAFRRELTGVGMIAGLAMFPTLNKGAASQPDAVERFLMRLIPHPVAQSNIFDGDVVAFTSPLVSPGSAEQVLVRRVAALEGDELVTADDADQDDGEATYVIPSVRVQFVSLFLESSRHPCLTHTHIHIQGYCWVLADNEDLTYPDVIDSRSFGPLPLHNIIGRVMYSARSETDHGPVENSEPAMESDAPILEAELDVDRLLVDNGVGESEGHGPSPPPTK